MWVGKIPWRRKRLPAPLLRPGEFHGLYSLWGCKESDTTERFSLSLSNIDDSENWLTLSAIYLIICSTLAVYTVSLGLQCVIFSLLLPCLNFGCGLSVYPFFPPEVGFFFPLASMCIHLCFKCCPAAAAAKSLQSCLTLCNPIDGSPPGSSVPGILQARILEWVALRMCFSTHSV